MPDRNGKLVDVNFRMAGVALEFPTAPKDAFLVANLLVLSGDLNPDWEGYRRIFDSGAWLLAQQRDAAFLALTGLFKDHVSNNYDTFRARGNIGNVYYWWYDRRTYLISMSPEEGYETLDRREYFSWVHRLPVSIYLLKKSGE